MVMSSLTRRIRRSGSNPATTSGWGNSWWNLGSRSLPGRGAGVSDSDALSLTAVYRGVGLIASTIAGLPMHVYEEDAADDTKKIKLKTPDTAYLWSRPNVEQTRQTMWEKVGWDEVRGNGFIFVDKNDIGGPASIWHVARQRVKVGRTSDRQKVYELDGELPMIDYKQGGEIVHIPNWGDGLVGYDPLQLAAQAISLGMSAEEYAARTFINAVPPGIITSELAMTEKQANTIRARWEATQGGLSNALRIAVLGNGAKFLQTSMDNEKLQMEALRRFQVQEIARLLGLPPHLLADVSSSTSWGTGIEEQNRSLVAFTLMAHINRIEQAINDNLLVTDLTRRYVKLALDGLLRGSTLQRYQAYSILWGRAVTANEIRKWEDLPPIEGGDVLMQPINMAPASAFDNVDLSQTRQPPSGQ